MIWAGTHYLPSGVDIMANPRLSPLCVARIFQDFRQRTSTQPDTIHFATKPRLRRFP